MKLRELLTERRDENEDFDDAVFAYFDQYFHGSAAGGGSGENPNIPGIYFALYFDDDEDIDLDLGKLIDTDDDSPEMAALKQKMEKRRKPEEVRALKRLQARKENLLRALKGLEHDTSMGKFLGYDTDGDSKSQKELQQVAGKTADELPDREIILYFKPK